MSDATSAFALNVSAAISVSHGDYDSALWKLKSALQSTKPLVQKVAAIIPLAVTSPSHQGARLYVNPASSADDLVRVDPDSHFLMVAQPFLVDLSTAPSCCKGDEFEKALLTSHIRSIRDAVLMLASLLFNIGLCHHLRFVRLPSPSSPNHGRSQHDDYREAVHYYQLALQSLERYSITSSTPGHSHPDRDDCFEDVILLVCAVSNNLCLLLHPHQPHCLVRQQPPNQSLQALLERTLPLATATATIESAASTTETPTTSVGFFLLNARHWRSLWTQPAAAA